MNPSPRTWPLQTNTPVREGFLACAEISRRGDLVWISPAPLDQQPPAELASPEDLELAMSRLSEPPGPNLVNIVQDGRGRWIECDSDLIASRGRELALRTFS